MKLYQLHSKQVLPITQKEAWKFLVNPTNLKKITPDYMGFNILSKQDEKMYPGQIIYYKVSPLPGIEITWVTEITYIKEGEYFVDEQRFGPYSLWHHKHFIKPINKGVIMEDIIDYKIPMGFLGQIAHSIIVKKKLQEIFTYRCLKLEDMFGKVDNHLPELNFKSI